MSGKTENLVVLSSLKMSWPQMWFSSSEGHVGMRMMAKWPLDYGLVT